MKSKTSSFNKAIFKKNLTRFAPLGLLYTLCLVLGMVMMYINDGRDFWFASRMGECIQYLALVNLFYAPLVAMLLFGDLYNARMCNALHAMPVRREELFYTNVLSSLVFSALPTAVMAVLSIPLLMNTCVVDAWQIALWFWMGSNLSYLCFFGIAVFSVFCVGNRVAMAVVYAALNGGAFIAYFLIDSIYTPMLYGVVTPSLWAEILTPISGLLQGAFVEVENYLDLRELFEGHLDEMTASFWINPEKWTTLVVWAAVGIALMVAAMQLYRKRDLECAGDAVALPILKPVFTVCAAVGVAASASLLLEMFFGTYYRENLQYIFLICGLVIGWFGAKMFIERTIRVFRPRNWLGLIGLTAVLALSLVLTHFDILGIETWTPAVEDVKTVTFGFNTYRGMSEELTEDADIRQVIRLQSLALEERLEESGDYPVIDGVVCPPETAADMDSETLHRIPFRYASQISIYYELENGRTVTRIYNVWGDGETGDIVNEYLSRWEVVDNTVYYQEAGVTVSGKVQSFGVNGVEVPEEYHTEEMVESLLSAIKADCENRTMTQRTPFHSGEFCYEYEDNKGQIQTGYTRAIWVDLNTEAGYCSFQIYADSENTLNWLRQYDLLAYEVSLENGYTG